MATPPIEQNSLDAMAIFESIDDINDSKDLDSGQTKKREKPKFKIFGACFSKQKEADGPNKDNRIKIVQQKSENEKEAIWTSQGVKIYIREKIYKQVTEAENRLQERKTSSEKDTNEEAIAAIKALEACSVKGNINSIQKGTEIIQYMSTRCINRVSEMFKLALDEVERMPDFLDTNISEDEQGPFRSCEEIISQGGARKTYYETRGKHGLLCILQHKQQDWKDRNQKDKDVLKKFFKDMLGFEVKKYTSYEHLDKNLEKDLSPRQYYCLVICISGHGNEKGVITKETDELKTVVDIKKRFGNEKIPRLAGVPKIIVLDTCRGEKYNKTVLLEDQSTKHVLNGQKASDLDSPTTDSDCLIVHATTHECRAFIPADEGSVGIQSVVKVLNENWKNDHLEEMLIDARREVAEWRHKKKQHLRQTLEIQSTLTKRLKFVKSKE